MSSTTNSVAPRRTRSQTWPFVTAAWLGSAPPMGKLNHGACRSVVDRSFFTDPSLTQLRKDLHLYQVWGQDGEVVCWKERGGLDRYLGTQVVHILGMLVWSKVLAQSWPELVTARYLAMGGDDDAELSPCGGVDHSSTDFLGCIG